jgi:hypothetical protein
VGLKEVLELVSNVAKLGASPAVQQALTQWLSAQMGVPQAVLDAAIRASKDAADPKE